MVMHTDLPIHKAGIELLGLAREQALIAKVLRKRGHAVKGDLTKIYRKKAA